MSYGLPSHGQTDYDVPLNNSVDAIKGVADAAKSQADIAVSTANVAAAEAAAAAASANAAAASATNLVAVVNAPADSQIADRVTDPTSATHSALAATFASQSDTIINAIIFGG